MEGILAELNGLESMGELGELGDLGAVATAASVSAASGVLAKIGSWLKPIKNIFNKIKGKVSTKKQSQPQITEQQAYTESNQSMVQPLSPANQKSKINTFNVQQDSVNTPVIPVNSQQTPTNMARTPTINNAKKGISKGAKLGIGIGAVALFGTGAYFLFRKKNNTVTRTNTKRKNSKKSLGTIEFS